jgi:hypothetical protein
LFPGSGWKRRAFRWSLLGRPWSYRGRGNGRQGSFRNYFADRQDLFLRLQLPLQLRDALLQGGRQGPGLGPAQEPQGWFGTSFLSGKLRSFQGDLDDSVCLWMAFEQTAVHADGLVCLSFQVQQLRQCVLCWQGHCCQVFPLRVAVPGQGLAAVAQRQVADIGAINQESFKTAPGFYRNDFRRHHGRLLPDKVLARLAALLLQSRPKGPIEKAGLDETA